MINDGVMAQKNVGRGGDFIRNHDNPEIPVALAQKRDQLDGWKTVQFAPQQQNAGLAVPDVLKNIDDRAGGHDMKAGKREKFGHFLLDPRVPICNEKGLHRTKARKLRWNE